MMTARLTVVSPGALAALQDCGRRGLRRAGVPQAGALVPDWLCIANLLAGNAPSHAALEFFGGGLTLRADAAPLRLALAGPVQAEIVARDGTRRSVPSWRGLTLAAGETLRCPTIAGARLAYVAVHGLQVMPLAGSAATYARAGFGQLLRSGDPLVAAVAPASVDQCIDPPPLPDGVRGVVAIRVVPGPQAAHFREEAQAAFLTAEYRVTTEADRMGVRLDGPLLAHRDAASAEIVSDATVPGSIQVPGNGRPIVLLNDGQTAGGYPKIATVISADLPYLALLPAGARVRFVAVSVAAAEAAARERAAELQARIAAIRCLGGDGDTGVDLDALYRENLVSGMVDAAP